MFRALLRLVVVVIVLVAAAAFFLGYRGRSVLHMPNGPGGASVGTSGHVDTERAREAGAAVGAKTADAANRAGELLTDGALTAKIKSKMALDDTVQARSIDVTTRDHVVTVSGVVRSDAERTRAVELARETAGVSRVVDQLRVGAR